MKQFICRYFSVVILAFILFPGTAGAATHVVSTGESLYLISQWYGTTVGAIKSANGLVDSTIYPGQTLYIPSPINETPRTVRGTAHVVSAGESLYLISQWYGTTVGAIKSANGLMNDIIYPGQKLYIPLTIHRSPDQVSRAALITARVPLSRADFDLLARLITAEADSESYLTKVAVGAVVINRVLSPLFPDTIPGVIYQFDVAYQFEPVLNGWINIPASEEAKRAAQEALNGIDPTNGALYFFESWVPNQFLQSRPVSLISDSFTFTY